MVNECDCNTKKEYYEKAKRMVKTKKKTMPKGGLSKMSKIKLKMFLGEPLDSKQRKKLQKTFTEAVTPNERPTPPRRTPPRSTPSPMMPRSIPAPASHPSAIHVENPSRSPVRRRLTFATAKKAKAKKVGRATRASNRRVGVAAENYLVPGLNDGRPAMDGHYDEFMDYAASRGL